MKKVSVIIVNYKTKRLTLKSIDSVLNEGSGCISEIIVIDNASNDDSVLAIRNKIRKIKKISGVFIENNLNLGFAKANNQGIKIAKGNYILLLNSDAYLKKSSVKKLLNFAEKNSDAGAVVPRLLNSDGTTQESVLLFPTIIRAIKEYWLGQKGIFEKYYPKEKKPTTVESAVMAAFLITPNALKKVGLLDEKYFFYYEDIDYCRKLKNNSLKIYYLPSSEVFHYHGASGKNLASAKDQWRRLIPSSKIYHGVFKHYLLNFIIWSGQKWQKLVG